MKKVFCGGNVWKHVDWNDDGVTMCPRWFSKGHCFRDCDNEESHVPDTEVPEGKREDYRAYLKAIRK